MHIALYRKYRSATFDEVFGQEHITTTLKNEVAGASPAHAYLFTGSRGTGKTSCAKIMAKALNCPNQQGGNPCNKCDICKGIDDGSIMDVLEIDAASNNGVDNIRDLRDEANFTPAVGKYRVYIIDEAHMLSTGAFNALLKIMEEPPAHVVFILATTEVHKIPAAVLSRCQRFDFHRIRPDVIVDRLRYIAQQEKFEIDNDAAELIARLSDGAFRDAISLLDLCSSYSSNIDIETVSAASGTVGQQHLFDIAKAISTGDAGIALKIVEQLSQQSLDSSRLCEQLINHFRNLMITKSTDRAEEFVDVTPADYKLMLEQAKLFALEQIIYCLNVLQGALASIGKTAKGKVELEIALITMCTPKLSDDKSAILARIEKLETALRTGSFARVDNAQVRSTVVQTISPQEYPETVMEQPAPEEISPTQSPIPSPDIADPVEAERMLSWREILGKLEKTNGALYGALINSSAYIRGSHVLIDCKDDFFLKLMRENEYAKECLKQAIFEVTGARMNIGPYRAQKNEKTQTDPLKEFIQNLDLPEDRVVIE